MNLKTTTQQPEPPDTEDFEFEFEEEEEVKLSQTRQHAMLLPPPLKLSTNSQPTAQQTNPPAAHPLPPASQPAPNSEHLPRRRFRRLLSKPMGFMLLGVLIVVALMAVVQKGLLPAWGWSQDQWHYGDARITQMDADVGHGGMSHFIATYSKGDIVIIEIPLDHPNPYHVYTLTGMVSTSGTPVILLSVQDVNHDGKPDLIVQTEGGDMSWVLYNTGTTFSMSEGQP